MVTIYGRYDKAKPPECTDWEKHSRSQEKAENDPGRAGGRTEYFDQTLQFRGAG